MDSVAVSARAGRGGFGRTGAPEPAWVGRDDLVGDRHVEDRPQEPVQLSHRRGARRPAGLDVPRAEGGRRDLVDGDVRPRPGEVVTPQAGVKDSGARTQVIAGEVVLGVLANGAAADIRRSPALAEQVGLLGGQPGPGVGFGAEDLGVASTIRAAIPSAKATAGKLVDCPERPLGPAATLPGASAVVRRRYR